MNSIPENQPYLTSEQINLMMAIQPDYQMKYETEMHQQDAIDFNALKRDSDPYDMRLPNDGATSRQLDLDDVMSDYKKMKKGGFAWLPTIVAPLITSLVPELVKSVSGLIRKKGSGAMFADFMSQNKDMLKSVEDEIRKSHPKNAWKLLLDNGKEIVKTILENTELGQKGEQYLNMIAEKIINRVVPKGFNKVLQRKEGKGMMLPNEGQLTNARMAEPVILYMLRKLIGDDQQARELLRRYKPKIRTGGEIFGGKLNFRKIMDFAKRAVKTILPLVSEAGKKALTNVADIGSKALINGLVKKFSGSDKPEGSGMPNPGYDMRPRPVIKRPEQVPNMVGSTGGFIKAPQNSSGGFISAPQNSSGGFTRPPQRSRGGASQKKKIPLKIKLL
jgi:hypothetical protein